VSVTTPQGFLAAGVAAGLKATGRPDVALVVNTGPAPAAAAVFTDNRFAAAPVTYSRGLLARGATPRAVVLNSGGANACTGPAGLEDTRATAAHTAALLDLTPDDVLVCSTGIIGERLDRRALLAGVSAAHAALDPEGGPAAAEAIMTTDTVPKTAAAAGPGGGYAIGGMAKGAGMLAPELATMLVVLTTDAVLEADEAAAHLAYAVAHSFNRIDSDGCQSTNDTVILLASGASGHTPEPEGFRANLTAVAQDLALQLIGDAEGSDHDIAITVTHAADEAGALAVARAIARSNLVKTAIYGRDANWGRILSAAGTVPAAVAPYDPARVALSINGVRVAEAGGAGAPRDTVVFDGRRVDIVLDLAAGDAEATIWTNDLTHGYVEENSAYSS
jgi:glutamate N-acetyltransferase/amino-acid N-acetyltransferase